MPTAISLPRSLQKDPDHGTLLISAIEEKVKWLPNETYMRYPAPDWEVQGYRTLTWANYGDSINKVAFWLDETLGKTTGNETVAYLGPNDLRYALLLPAVVKTGRKLLIPSDTVTDEGLKNLLQATDCKVWIRAQNDKVDPPSSLPPSLKKIELPSVEWCLDAFGHKHYHYEKSWDEGKWDEILVIHTSGTTGIPKPIYHTNGFYASGKARELGSIHFPRGIMFDVWMGRSMLSPCPPQWLGGLYHYVFFPVYQDTTCVVPPADCTLFSANVMQKLVRMNVVDGFFGPPFTIGQLYANTEARQLLKNFQYIIYAGSALEQKIGDDLVEHTKLVSAIGSTETGIQITFLPVDRRLWYTHDFVPENGHRMDRLEGSGAAADGSDDMFELTLERSTSKDPSLFQSAFWNTLFKDRQVNIETKELYSPIKDIDGRTRWVFNTRKDDLIKLKWLAKFHAGDIEKQIQQHPDVSSVFVGGQGRPTPYVIIEPKDGVLEKKAAEDLLNEIYAEVVSGSNKANSQDIRIPKETILVTKPGKPFKKSFKQTLMRKEIEKDYSVEIEEAYKQLAK